jgi:hypothetical protein
VFVPIVLPLKIIVAKGIASFVSASVTLPVIVVVCALIANGINATPTKRNKNVLLKIELNFIR